MTTTTTTTNAQLDSQGCIIALRDGSPDGNRDEITLDLAVGETAHVGDHVTVDDDGVGTLDETQEDATMTKTTNIELLSDDGQGYRLYQVGDGMARVMYEPDTHEILAIDTDCDGWDQEGLGYTCATPAELTALAAHVDFAGELDAD
jgi:hypothetical protein